MSDLSPKAEDLVRAGRAALQPNEADRQRVLAALLPQVGGGSQSGSPAEPAGALAGKAIAVKALAALVGFGVTGGALLLALRSEPRPVQQEATRPTAPAPATPDVITEPRGEAVAPQAPTKRALAATRSADRLAQEVAILSRASTELHAGHPAAALAALAEHQEKFPTGMLVEERRAARVQALCALGRTQEAKTELVQLERTAPNSPHVARARKACGFDPGSE